MVNLAIRDIRHSLGKFLATALGVGMLLGVVLIMIGVYRGLINDAKILLTDINADIWVVQKDTLGPFAENSRLHEDLKRQIRAIRGVENTSAVTFQNIQLYKDNKPVRVFAVGYEIGSFFEPHLIVKGRPIQLSHFEIVVDEKTGFELNEIISIGRDDFRVVGVMRKASSSGGDPMAYISLSDAQKLQFLSGNEQIRNDRARGLKSASTNTVNAVIARTYNGFEARDVAENIKRWKHLGVFTDEEQSDILTKNLVERSAKQIGMFTMILLIVSAVIISLIIYTMTIGKIKEIAILKLIGASNGIIAKMIIQQSLVLGILAFIAGNIFSHSLYKLFPKTVILAPLDALKLFVIVVIVSIIGSISGVRQALRVDPSTAIGG
ncbi:MAG TPA: ABC transporter permease [Campylobacterales bacterium]|nr:ABC transporter permease [Campylobacterales bacterium]